MRRKFLVVLLLVLLPYVACNSKPVRPIVSPLGSPASPLLTATSQPTTMPTLKATATPWPTSTATSVPTAAPTPVGIIPPPGLIYRTESGIWRVEADGQSIRLFQRPYGVAFSANDTSALYFDGDPKPDQI